MDNQTVMNFQRRYLHISCFAMAISALLFTNIIFAGQYQLKQIVDLSKFSDVSNDATWLKPLNDPSNDTNFFVAQDNGLIYLAGKERVNNQEAILNLPLKANNPTFVSLTAMALHPSFTQPEKPGYATLYTVHTTEFDQETTHNRLILKDTNIIFAFETVITAWQYDFDKQKIDPQTQREVLRIPIKTQDSAIQQLTFDPFQKYWNADYGQLYFSLRYINELKHHPLYSGVILRINPLIFGARNYTVPQSNPFVKEPNINDAIVILGSQNVEHFFWAKNNHASIFIQHNNGEQHWLSKASVGDDLLNQPQSNFLWQQSTIMTSRLLYQGRDFLSLRDKMVFFTLLDKKWHLTSLALAPLDNESTVFEELIATEDLSPTSQLSIHQDNKGEIILFDTHQSGLYSLQPININANEVPVLKSNTTDVKSDNYIWLLSTVAVLLSLLFFINRKKRGQKLASYSLHKGYTRFEYEPTTQNILLFKTNKKKVCKTLTLDEIIRCEVSLNNIVVNIFDDKPENVISNQSEVAIRELFTKEHSKKMVDEQTRQVEIVLFDKDDSYTVFLYLREGNNRVTGETYYEVIEILLDLCWVISKHINEQATETRLNPRIAFSPISARKKSLRQAEHRDNTNHSIEEPAESETTQPKSTGQATQQNELVDALDKIVSLHQQGYLTDEEFSLAKSKLLQ
jgi:hypothetical protein